MSPVDPLRTPQTALDLQLALLEAMDDRIMDHALRLRQGEVIALDQSPTGRTVRREPRYEPHAATVGPGLEGRTIWVGADIVPMIEQAASTIPAPDGGHLAADMIPAPEGTVWFAGADTLPISETTGSGEVEPVIGVSWAVTADAAYTVDGGRALGVTLWPWLRLGERLPVLGTCAVVAVAPAAAAMIGLDPADMPTPVQLDWADTWGAPDGELLRTMLATWVLCAQVLPRHIETANRAQRRRASRVLHRDPIEWGEVHVSTLRTMHRDDGTGGDGDGLAWTHQWVVSGHWRWQPCGPGRSERRLTWIAPYVKGPDGAPLLQVEQVAKLVR